MADAPDLGLEASIHTAIYPHKKYFRREVSATSLHFFYTSASDSTRQTFEEVFIMTRGIQIKGEGKFTPLSTALNQFLLRCKIKNLSNRTIENYEAVGRHFIEVCENPPVSALNRIMIDIFILQAKEHHNSENYINTQLRHIRTFVYFCQKEYNLIPFQIELIKTDEVIKEPYSKEELRKLLEYPTTASFVDWRTWAMINFFLGTGCRISTALEVKWEDIDYEHKLITFRKLKNRKQQIVPMSTSLFNSLLAYKELWEAQNNDYIFPTYERKKLSVRQAQDTLQKYHMKRGVYRYGAHRYRHTFAREYILQGGQPLQLQQLLGHSTLDITRKYVRLYATDLQRDYDKLCPLDNI